MFEWSCTYYFIVMCFSQVFGIYTAILCCVARDCQTWQKSKYYSPSLPDITKLNSLFANGFIFLVASMIDQGWTTKGGKS